MKAALLYLFAASAWAQSMAPVAVTGAPAATGWSFPWWGWIVAGVAVGIAVHLALRKWWPAAAAKVQASASTDAAALGKVIADALAHAKANPAEPAVAVVATPDLQPELEKANGKLAQIKPLLEQVRAIVDAA